MPKKTGQIFDRNTRKKTMPEQTEQQMEDWSLNFHLVTGQTIQQLSEILGILVESEQDQFLTDLQSAVGDLFKRASEARRCGESFDTAAWSGSEKVTLH